MAIYYKGKSVGNVLMNMPTAIIEAVTNAYAAEGDVVVPNGVTKIHSHMFRSAKEITSISFPDTLKEIAGYAFYSCEKLTHIELPAALEIIGTTSFYACVGLNEITIPKTVRVIASSAFAYNNITSVTFEGTPKSIGENAFNACPALVNIYVPWEEGAVEGAPWGAKAATINYNYVPSEE